MTAGAGSIGCAALAGAAGNMVQYAVGTPTNQWSLGGFLKTGAEGALTGAIGGVAGKFLGSAVSSLGGKVFGKALGTIEEGAEGAESTAVNEATDAVGARAAGDATTAEDAAATQAGPFQGASQSAPGGRPARESASTRSRWPSVGGNERQQYDIVHEPTIIAGDGELAYGASPHTGSGLPFLGPRGRPLIQISDLGLRDMDEAVTTIFHEIYHHNSFALRGVGGSEEAAEAFGRQMLSVFRSRVG